MRNTVKTVRTIAEIGIIAALGFVFDELQGILFKGVFVNGGSIGFAMIAVLIIAYRRGVIPALLTGLIMGLLDVSTSAYILHPAQLLLDYIFPYALVGIAGLLKPLYDKANSKGLKVTWLIAGAVVGGLLKFLSHYFAGVIFWSSDPSAFAWNLQAMNPYLYCFVYNIAFMGPCIILTAGLLVAIQFTAPRILENKAIIKEEDQGDNKTIPMVLNIATIAGGSFLFIFYLIKFICSFESYQDGSAFGYDADPDAMLITVVGLFLIVLGVINLVRTLKGNFNMTRYMLGFTMISLTTFIYGLARLVRTYVKNKPHDPYWLWFVITCIIVNVAVGLLIYLLINNHIKGKDNKD